MATRPRRDTFEATCLPFLGDCRAFAISLTRRPHDADDLVQETYLRAQRAFDRFEPGTNAKAWLFTILRRLHVDRYRRSRRAAVPVPEEELIGLAPPVPPPGEDAVPWDALPPGAVARAIDALPEAFRLAVRLRDLHGLAYREIAEILDVPVGTVMSRLFRGRESLRAALVALVSRRGRRAEP